MMTGSATSTAAAATTVWSVVRCDPAKNDSASGAVKTRPLGFITSASRKSFQVYM
jgi:hypothetical protein